MKTLRPILLLLLFAGTASAQQAEPIVAGRAYERALRAGESHVYTLQLEGDWFVTGRVDAAGDDVTVTVTGPDDAHVERFDAAAGPSLFRFSTETSGTHRIQVSAPEESEPARYVLRLREVEPVATTAEGKVDQMMAMFDETTPGGMVAVVRDGKVTFARGYGMADLEHGVRFTPETVTNIGSTSKQFTGFALALLASRGQLSLDDDVRKYVPEVKDFGKPVTIRHILSHTSGYREFINTLVLTGRMVMAGDHVDRDEILDIVERQPRLQNDPGAEFNYNNTAFAIGAMIVERVSGKPFGEWMEQEVFGPLGMENTVVKAHPGQVIPNRSIGYTPAEEGFRTVADLGGSMGAGGIYTTAADLARWMGNLHTGKLGGPEVMREMKTRFILTDGDTTSYGKGIFIDEDRGLARIHHGGADVAHRSTFVFYPELNAGYLVQSNYSNLPGSIGRGVAEAFFGEHMEKEEEKEKPAAGAAPVMVDRKILEGYVGRYELEVAPVVITISYEEEGLRLQLPGQPAAELVATSDSTFTIQGVEASVTFHSGEGGAVDRMTLHQNGNQVARRLADGPGVALGDYVGRYFSEELETFYDLAIEEGKLVLSQRRFGDVPLSHTSGEKFTGGFPVATVDFERDAQGRVTGLRAGNGRARDIWFERR